MGIYNNKNEVNNIEYVEYMEHALLTHFYYFFFEKPLFT